MARLIKLKWRAVSLYLLRCDTHALPTKLVSCGRITVNSSTALEKYSTLGSYIHVIKIDYLEKKTKLLLVIF